MAQRKRTTSWRLLHNPLSFICQTLTKISENGEKSIYSSIKKLQEWLVSNVVNIQSTLCDGINGHLFLVLSPTECTAVTISATHLVRVPVAVAPIMLVQPLSLVQRSITSPTTNIRYGVTDKFRNYKLLRLSISCVTAHVIH